MQLGFVGLGKMGGPMASRLHAAGHDVIVFDLNADARHVAAANGIKVAASPGELATRLAPARIVWIMTPPGAATEEALRKLSEVLEQDDLVVDGGNSDFRDTARRAAALAAGGIGLVDAGVSGGTHGAQTGCGLLVGADGDAYSRLMPIFETLAAPGACALVGGSGAGHFAKAVHNGVEYAIMQAYGEGYELLQAADIKVDVLATLQAWQNGCSVRSHLLGKLVQALSVDPSLAGIKGQAADSGMGRWTVEEAIRLRVPTPAISAALKARFRSQQEDSPTMKSIAALRGAIGGHHVPRVGDDK